jgi:hypothetical protein
MSRRTPNRTPAKPPTKRGRGRPPKRVVPHDDQTPNGSDSAEPTDVTTAQAIDRQLAVVRQRADSGARLANHEMRLLKETWLHEMSLHIWPSLDAAAADLGMSPSSLRAFKDQGCPGIEPHSPIPKSPVLAWLLKRAHERGGERFANTHVAEEADARWKLARAAEKERTLVAQAEDLAQQGLLTACTALRSRLLHALPAAIYETARTEPDRTAAESRIAALIENAISDGARIAPVETTPASEGTPA